MNVGSITEDLNNHFPLTISQLRNIAGLTQNDFNLFAFKLNMSNGISEIPTSTGVKNV